MTGVTRYAPFMRNLIIALMLLAGCRSGGPDLILAGGRIFTADEARPWAEAIAIKGDRIVAVGTDAEIRALATPLTRVIELAGRVVVPGMNDAHGHEPGSLPGSKWLNVAEDATIEALFDALREGTQKHPEGTLLRAEIPVAQFDDPRLSREQLDALVPRHPVMLSTLAGHSTVHNSLALQYRGVGEDVQDTRGGAYGRDTNGRLNGWLYEHALWESDRALVSKLSDDTLVKEMRRFAKEALRLGVTSLQTMPIVDADQVKHVAAAADIPVRVRWIDFRIESVDDTPRGPIKYIIDGTPVERGAAMSSGYVDRPGHHGRINYSDDDLRRIVTAAANTDAPLLLHIVGDVGLEKLFALMRATPANWPAKRVRIEHGEMIGRFADDAKELGIVLVQNPSHLMLADLMKQRIGAADLRGYQALRSMAARGIPIAIGSDGPLNPWLNVMFATMHPTNPAEALTREQAVIAYTRGAAFAEFAEKDKGTLAPGMLADLVVLSQDVFTVPPPELPKTQSVLTMIGGKIVWEQR
jgi:predicted amidohydrolase YtcJ